MRQRLSEFSGNSRVIIERIMAAPEVVIQKKVSEFARDCHCDGAQVVRLCQKLGYDGFPSLKSRIATELMDPQRTLHRQLAESMTSFEQTKQAFSKNCMTAINDTLGELEEKTLAQAIDLMKQARHIVIGGFGSSSSAARDLRMKLFRIGLYAMFFDDAEELRAACAALT
ncbi:MAG: MurR/RpiR family transcriptional regulator, partial [Victivallaceae bacterium]|nr:MurR/RpiR family transcriptional regulator [Victivallaceae bacterium]